MNEPTARRFQETIGEFVQRTCNEKANRERLKVFIANMGDVSKVIETSTLPITERDTNT